MIENFAILKKGINFQSIIFYVVITSVIHDKITVRNYFTKEV